MQLATDVDTGGTGPSSVPVELLPTDTRIVPMAGLPFVAVALAFIVFAIASDSSWALMLAHVAGVACGREWTCTSD